MSGAFDELLQELDSVGRLAKAMPAEGDDDDDYISNMADGDADDDGVPDNDDPDLNGDGDEDEDDDDELMGKSLRVSLANGETMEALDGTKLVKSLIAEQSALKSGVAEVMGQTVALLRSMREEMSEDRKSIAYLKKSLTKLSGAPAGRRSATNVQVIDRSSGPGGMPDAQAYASAKEQLLTKAQTAYDQGKINSVELNSLDLAFRRNQAPADSILKKIA